MVSPFTKQHMIIGGLVVLGIAALVIAYTLYKKNNPPPPTGGGTNPPPPGNTTPPSSGGGTTPPPGSTTPTPTYTYNASTGSWVGKFTVYNQTSGSFSLYNQGGGTAMLIVAANNYDVFTDQTIQLNTPNPTVTVTNGNTLYAKIPASGFSTITYSKNPSGVYSIVAA